MLTTSLAAQKSDPWEPPCFIEGLPFDEYLQLDAASSHALGTLLDKSPLHVKEPADKPSATKGLGTLLHALLLTPDDVGSQVVIKPAGADKTSNATKILLVRWLCDVTEAVDPPVDVTLALGKQLDAKLRILEPLLVDTGLTVCSPDQMDAAQRMRDNVLAKDIGRIIFDAGRAEVTMLAYDPRTGVLCRGRADWLPDGHEAIVDLKSAASAAFEEFARAAGRFNYHLQASFYCSLYHLVTGSKRPSFLHVVVENEPPYDCAFYELGEEELLAGERKVMRALDIWKRCEDMGYWPGIGYDFECREYTIQKLTMPKWAL